MDFKDDYMSEEFIKEVPEPKQTTIRKRRKEPETIKPLKERERESLTKGLATSIAPENKGYKLLQLMGYKEGMSLGKTEDAIKEPITINIKQGRSGLGIEESKRRKIEKETVMKQTNEKKMYSTFKGRMSDKFVEKKYFGMTKQALKVCVQLDQQKEITTSEFYKNPSEPDSEEEEEDTQSKTNREHVIREKRSFRELEPQEKAKRVIEYLRTTHFYCFYCGAVYSDKADLDQNCPGTEEEDH